MKILLIYPYCLEDRLHAEDAGVVPMGVYSVGAVLKANGWDVQIYNFSDFRNTPEKIGRILETERPDVVGLSILNANRWGGIDTARMAKQIDPSVTVVFGGIGATFLWRHLLDHFPQVDYIVTGEGEITFLRLIERLAAGDRAGVEKTRGLALRQNGRPVKTRPRPPVADLDTLPDPARYFTYQHVALTRGCPGRCTFCGSPQFWGGTVRFHTADRFVDQIERLHRKGVGFFFISDDTFTLKKSLVLDICRKIRDRQLAITWAAISRVDTVDQDVLFAMRKAGCIQISYGVESGSAQNRRWLNKPISDDAIQKAFDLTAGCGIMARAYFIYGLAGENRKSIQATLDLMDRIRPLSAIFYILDIFPGTVLYADFKARTGSTDDVWLSRIEDILYFETDPDLGRQKVLAFGQRLRNHFYTNLPRYAESVKLADRADFYPLHADFLSRLAMTFDQGDYAQVAAIPDKRQTAEGLYRRALSYHPDSRAYLGLAILAQRRGDHTDAIDILTRATADFPDDAQLFLCLAVSHMNRGAFETALSHLLRFKSAEGAAPLIAGCYRALGRPESDFDPDTHDR